MSAFFHGSLVVIMSRNVKVISPLHSDFLILTKYFANDGSLEKKEKILLNETSSRNLPVYHTNKLTLAAQCISESCIEVKINVNVYFHTFL